MNIHEYVPEGQVPLSLLAQGAIMKAVAREAADVGRPARFHGFQGQLEGVQSLCQRCGVEDPTAILMCTIGAAPIRMNWRQGLGVLRVALSLERQERLSKKEVAEFMDWIDQFFDPRQLAAHRNQVDTPEEADPAAMLMIPRGKKGRRAGAVLRFSLRLLGHFLPPEVAKKSYVPVCDHLSQRYLRVIGSYTSPWTRAVVTIGYIYSAVSEWAELLNVSLVPDWAIKIFDKYRGS